MSQTEAPVGLADHRDLAPVEQGGGTPPSEVVPQHGGGGKRPIAALIAGSLLCFICLGFLFGGGWTLWKHTIDRDGAGFVSIRKPHLQTEQFAIVGSLQGDGPDWLYSKRLWGDERVRATSTGEQPLFVGIARTSDVFRYLHGVGYASIEGFEIRRSGTHAGSAPSDSPSTQTIWAASTVGTGQQTLRWTPRAGKWSVVIMNADATAGVSVRGDAAAKLPVLPWIVLVCLVFAAAAGLAGGPILVRAIRQTTSA